MMPKSTRFFLHVLNKISTHCKALASIAILENSEHKSSSFDERERWFLEVLIKLGTVTVI
jgi:hypothetical protein